MLRFLPGAAALAVAVFLLAALASARLNRRLTLAAFGVFGGRAIEHSAARERLLRSAAVGVPYREYASKTYLYAAAVGVSSGILGVYLGLGAFAVAEAYGLWQDPVSFFGPTPALDTLQFGLLAVSGLGFGVVAGVGTYALRWQLPASRADTRRRQIDAGLPRMVAFMYALSRGGMSVPDVFRTLDANEAVFGEGAAEFGTAVRNMDLFNVDVVTAVEDLSERTPSEQLSTFTENLASVLQSGGSVSDFLEEQYERYRNEAEEQQAEMLNVLATTSEVYVTIVVAGMLFLITILLIIGLTVGDTLFVMRAITYLVLPATNLLFLTYLLDITQPLRAGADRQRSESGAAAPNGSPSVEADGGYVRPGSSRNHERLFAYRRIRSVLEALRTPVASIVERPARVLYLTVPIALAVTAYRFPSALSGGGIDVEVLDDLLVQATLFLTGTFAVVYEYKKRRLGSLEAAVPDLLERLASLNEAGIAMVSSFKRVQRSDLGSLDDEVDRIWRDMNWGATVEEALSRFEKRVRTPSVTRVVTLITNAMDASNEIGPVLRIAARQARSDLALRRKRKQEMFTYLVVIYVSFLVFLIVIGALEQVLIPSLPDTGSIGGGTGTGVGGVGAPGLGSIGSADRAAYRLVFFHTAIIQSVVSGLVGGVMGNGSIKDGLKHTTAMLAITYVVLVVVV
ncbi:type II secretion system F family protein [Natronomonas sp.]|uniref:type II secretion system F family protein n=1 Tax=Natronomonas sp. TaxID=2184060 RepID=UPI0026082615|nr:type II secretion system F family protein [Natronomonas sp.]